MAKSFGDRWVLQEPACEGGQGHLYIVKDLQNPDSTDQYILKCLKNSKRLGRFRDEVVAVNRLKAAPIAPVVDVDLDNDRPYYVMPYYSNGSLVDAKANELPLKEKIRISGVLTSTVAVLHNEGIIHRDIKPANVLLSEDGSPVLCDFGLCYIENGIRHTLTDEPVGSRYYIPPEYEGGGVVDATKTGDIYSLGKTLYWLYSGQMFPRERHREARFDLVELHNEPKYETLNRLLDKCICENPAQRYEDAIQMSVELAKTLEDLENCINFPSSSLIQRCTYCGMGEMIPLGSANNDGTTATAAIDRHSGLNRVSGGHPKRAMHCSTCGHMEIFLLANESARKLWQS